MDNLLVQKMRDEFPRLDVLRTRVRRALHRIRRNVIDTPEDEAIKELFESQFNNRHTWNLFTFSWDVGVKDPFKLSTKETWVADGGKFDILGNRQPVAFTEQV